MYVIEQQAKIRREQFMCEAEYARLAKLSAGPSQRNTWQPRDIKQSLRTLWNQTLQQIVGLDKPQSVFVPEEQCLECMSSA